MTFCNNILYEHDKNIKPNLLKLFCALGLAPSFLISEVRNLRNKIEHEYEIPKHEDVIKAIEVADLLINSIGFKKIYCYEMIISDVKNTNKGISFEQSYGLDIPDKTSFNLFYVEMPDEMHIHRKRYYSFNGNELIYYYLLRAIIIAEHNDEDFKETIKLLIHEIVPNQPIEHIHIKMISYY